MTLTLRLLETSAEMAAVEQLQRLVWPGSETDIVPGHMLQAAVHGGGLVIGAFTGESRPFEAALEMESSPAPSPVGPLVGFVFGFPGTYPTPDGPRLKHYSHMLGVHPEFRNQGIGFRLKRAQWQMARRQGVDRVTWTYDPLLSVNARLNIAQLGAVCNTYHADFYGEMRDGLNAGLPSDRFEVDWWINTRRVEMHLSRESRQVLDVEHYRAAHTTVLNPALLAPGGWVQPGEAPLPNPDYPTPLLMVEIPPDFQALRRANSGLAQEWRLHTRTIFQVLFEQGYLVTDFVHSPGELPRSYYVLAHGEAEIGGVKRSDF